MTSAWYNHYLPARRLSLASTSSIHLVPSINSSFAGQTNSAFYELLIRLRAEKVLQPAQMYL